MSGPDSASESRGVGQGQLSVEATGETVGEAKWSAYRELERLHPGLDRSAVRFQVVTEGERGLLGVGYAPARVVASIDAAAAEAGEAPARDESPLAAHARELVERIARGIGLACRVDVVEEDERLVVTCSGHDLGLLIGKHGQTIDSVQYLVNAIVIRRGDGKEVVVDAAGYRARRQASLEALATRAAERALATGAEVELDPMTAVERKLVHLCLQDVPGVATRSEGTEPNRYVVIVPGAD
jgi:spoIIIJ-associated protein